MARFGYFLASEEHSPDELLRQARLAEQAGFEALWISDHFHPWVDTQGESSFVWSMIGALSQVTSLPVTVAVTCPIIRVHPAIVAQAAATCAALTDGRFTLGLGTGEALNEHVVGARWPPAAERLVMLEEAVRVIRRLFTGEMVTHRGDHFAVDTARLYTLPAQPPPIYISALGRKSARVAGRIGDGLITTKLDPKILGEFRAAAGPAKPAQGGLKVCWAADAATARRHVLRLWPNELIPGEAAQNLPVPRHFAQLADMVDESMVDAAVPVGPDPRVHVAAIRRYVEAGFDQVYINQIGPEQDKFFEFYATEVLPQLK